MTADAPTPDVPSFVDLFGGDMVAGVDDPWPVYERMRRQQPVMPVSGIGGIVYLLTRYDDVRAVLRDDVTFSNRSNATGISLVMGRTIVEMDGAEHLRHRNIVTPALAPRALKGDFPDLVESIASELVDEFAAAGRADLVPAFTFSYPLRVFTRILGLAVEDYDRIHRWGIDITRVAQDPARGLEAARLLGDYLRPVVEKRRTDPTDDLISRLVEAEVDGHRLEDEEVISFLRLLVLAGAETTYHLMGSVLYGLLSQPEDLEALRADPSLMRSVLDEGLRWESPVQIVTREATRDVEIAGTTIPAGGTAILCVGAANRDPEHFADPDRFDIRRGADDHLAFGLGRHYCAGSRLAYLEAEVGLRVLLERLPGLRLDPNESCGVVGLAFRGPDRLPVLFDA